MTMVWGDVNEAVDIELELYIAIECELPVRSPKDVLDDAMSLRLTKHNCVNWPYHILQAAERHMK